MSRLSKDSAVRELPRILVIGSANVDMAMGLPRLPNRGETVTGGTFMQTFGGKGANQAVAARRAGAEVSFLCCLGDDAHGEAISATLKADGIDMSWSVRTRNAPTGAALVMYDVRGANYLAVAPGANFQLAPAHVEACVPAIPHLAMIVLQCEIPERTLRASFSAASQKGVPVLFNHAPACEVSIDASGLKCGIVVNEIEARMLSGIDVYNTATARIAARLLRARDYGFAIVTLGEKGCIVVSHDVDIHVPAIDVPAIDTTAAGDCFCGSLAAALVEGAQLPAAVRFATVAASICVRRAGAQPSIPRRAEIDAEREHLVGSANTPLAGEPHRLISE